MGILVEIKDFRIGGQTKIFVQEVYLTASNLEIAIVRSYLITN